jgi:hypothetical protein
MTGAEWVSIGLGFFAILVAIAIPLWIEWRKRPMLSIEPGENADRDAPSWRIVHVRVLNTPIPGRLGRFLLRQNADGCTGWVELRSRSGGAPIAFEAKWSSSPEPIQTLAIGGRAVEFYDPQKLPIALVATVPPTKGGQTIAVAIKHNGDPHAYGFGKGLYADPNPGPLRTPSLALQDSEYDVTVTVEAGQLNCDARFVLYNRGPERDDLELRPAGHPPDPVTALEDAVGQGSTPDS